MTIKDFAEAFNVKMRRDESGDAVIEGKAGHISDGYGASLGCCFEFETKRKWKAVCHRLESAGFNLRQNGDTEGVLIFDPADKDQARLALQAARVRTWRAVVPPSPAQLAARQAFAEARKAA